MSDWAIRVEGLGKRYFGGRRRRVTRLSEAITERARNAFRSSLLVSSRTAGKQASTAPGEPFWALRHVCLEVRRGESLGILGGNGAGKTTLLRILSGITLPSEGSAQIRGRLAALLDFGAALHGELTGRENVHLYGAVLGMTKTETRCKFDEIVSFAGLENSIDTPIKRYSTGMCLRLAFSVAAHRDGDVLLVDDVLGAADATFQKKCLERMTATAGEGRGVLMVSHEPEHIRRFCKRGIVVARGRVVYSGSAAEAADVYASVVDQAFHSRSPGMQEAMKEA